MHLLSSALLVEECWVQLEVVDDVSLAFQDGRPPKVIQVHSEAGSRALTDRSEKVWKTIGIWSRQVAQADPSPDSDFVLVSTQTAQDDSGVSLLRAGNRRPDEARSRLEAAASDIPGAETTAKDRAAFLDLSESRRKSLVERILVDDEAMPAVEMRSALTKALTPTHDVRFLDDMAAAVEGWWWGRVPIALKTSEAIGSEELRAQIDAARRRLSDASLPIIRDLEKFEKGDLPEGDLSGELFLDRLEAIRASATRREAAVSDYRLAFAHRSRWTRQGLVTLDEIGTYDDRLVGHWSQGCDEMLRHLQPDADDGTRSTAGHDLWDEMEKGNFTPIRRETTEPFIQKGSFHQLANDERVSWHPDSAAPMYERRASQ
jgi:hypothetical protein